MPEANQRPFDWGPPAGAGDGLKEWLIYFVIIVLLGAGVWILLDINGQKEFSHAKQQVATAAKTTPSTTASLPAAASNDLVAAGQPVAPAPAQKFYVQLGAFADESSAQEVFDQLTADGFLPTLALPDDQYEIHRVLVGPFNTELEAEEKAEQLNVLGLHCFVSESP